MVQHTSCVAAHTRELQRSNGDKAGAVPLLSGWCSTAERPAPPILSGSHASGFQTRHLPSAPCKYSAGSGVPTWQHCSYGMIHVQVGCAML